MSDPSLAPKTSSAPSSPEVPSLESPLPSLEERVARLEHDLETLINVVNANGDVMRDCLSMLEAQQWMTKEAVNDLAMDAGLMMKTGVDWQQLKDRYLEAAQKQESPATEPEESEHPEGAVVFGGG